MKHQVHAANAEHRHAGIRIESVEGFFLTEIPLLFGQLAAGDAVRITLVVIGQIARVGVRF